MVGGDEIEKIEVETTGVKPTSTLLHIAVRRSDYSSVCEFLDQMKYNVNSRDSDNNTPLHVAAELENIDILHLLLNKGALVNVKNNQNETPMHKAATSTTSEIVESLLKSGGSVNIYNKEGFTPFHMAVAKGYKKVIELMLDWGAEVHSRASKKQTPLHIAAIHWNCILAEILLDRGAHVNTRDCDGKTPLHLAVDRVDMTMAELLLERGADVNAPDYEGQTPLHLAANHWNLRIVKMLLERGSLINTQNMKGQSALHIAVNNGDLTLVNKLVDKGALTDVYDNQGFTPLQYAVRHDYAKLMLKLISKGADVSVFSKDLDSSEDLLHDPRSGPILQVHMSRIKLSQSEQSGSVATSSENFELKSLCLQELEKIKLKKVVDMSGNEYELIHVLDENRLFDESTCKLFEVMLSSRDVDTEFPLYAFILKVSLLRMKNRNKFIRAAQVFFVLHNFFNNTLSNSFPTLPQNIREQILRRLSYIDLQNLIVVSENTLRIKNQCPC